MSFCTLKESGPIKPNQSDPTDFSGILAPAARQARADAVTGLCGAGARGWERIDHMAIGETGKRGPEIGKESR